MKHKINPRLLSIPVKIALVGIGGTGSQILSGLARLHIAMKSLGHPHGLDVTTFDPDEVTAANVGRQLFYADDIGRNKAQVLTDRINLAYRLDWESIPERFSEREYYAGFDILIGCVDNRVSRKSIMGALSHTRCSYYLDCGNGPDYGQVIFGNGKDISSPWEVCPDLISNAPDNEEPSCSLAEALFSQELFVNQMTATLALQLLWQLFRHGGLDYQGFFFNLNTGRTVPIPIKPQEDKK